MAHELTITEIRLIRSLLSVKTDAEIADWLEKPVELITQVVSPMGSDIKRPTQKARNEQKLISEEKKATARRQKMIEARKRELERITLKRRKAEQSILLSRKIDLTGCIPVRLNDKTVVYVKPGTNIEILKQGLNIK